MEYEFTEHASDMLRERKIQKVWVEWAIEDPDKKEMEEDGTVHYIRAIPQFGGRHL